MMSRKASQNAQHSKPRGKIRSLYQGSTAVSQEMVRTVCEATGGTETPKSLRISKS